VTEAVGSSATPERLTRILDSLTKAAAAEVKPGGQAYSFIGGGIGE
jgi:hypothetical protein